MKKSTNRRILLVSLCLLSMACVLRGNAPQATPEQRFFDWTEFQFPTSEYRVRRDAMIQQLKDAGGGLFLAPAMDGFSQGETFRQRDDFLYFTGLELPNAMLLLDADSGTTTLFAPERDLRFESSTRVNDFPGRPLAADVTIARRAGLGAFSPIEKLEKALASRIADGRSVWIDVGRTMDLEGWSTGFLRELSAEQTLALRLSRAFPEVELKNAYPAIARLRMVKSPLEIEAIRRAVRITADGILAAPPDWSWPPPRWRGPSGVIW